jgi:putative transposase
MAQRRERTGEFKAKIVLEALRGNKTINEIASRYGVHPVQVTQWKKQVLEELPGVFTDRGGRAMREAEEEKARLYEQIGRLKVELEWLKKKLGQAQ